MARLLQFSLGYASIVAILGVVSATSTCASSATTVSVQSFPVRPGPSEAPPTGPSSVPTFICLGDRLDQMALVRDKAPTGTGAVSVALGVGVAGPRGRQSWVLPAGVLRTDVEDKFLSTSLLSPGEVLFHLCSGYWQRTPLFVLDTKAGELRRAEAPRPYSSYLAACGARGMIYAVLEPLLRDYDALAQKGILPSTLLVEIGPRGRVNRVMRIEVHHPIEHLEGELNGVLPMAVSGERLFIVENPGKVGLDKPGRFKFRFDADVQVVNLTKWALEANVRLPGMDEGVYGYAVYAGSNGVYVKEAITPKARGQRLYRYEGNARKFSFIGTVPAMVGYEGPTYSFAVIQGRIYYASLSGPVRVRLVPARPVDLR